MFSLEYWMDTYSVILVMNLTVFLILSSALSTSMARKA